jgi:hypothetical protein
MPPINPNAQRIIDTCESEFAANSSDCNHFLKAVSGKLGVMLPAGADANHLVDYLSDAGNGWQKLDDGDGAAAREAAAVGMFVVVGLKGSEHADHRANGHVCVIVAGEPDGNGYPMGYWGSSTPGLAKKATSIRKIWREGDVDNVHYFKRAL